MWIRRFLIGSLLCIVLFFTYMLDVFVMFDNVFKDYWYQNLVGTPSTNIHVIGIDGETLEALGPFEEWSREGVAQLITLLNKEEDTRPAVIGVDIMFFGHKSQEVDSVLVDAMAIEDNIILANQVLFGTQVVEETSDTVYVNYDYVEQLYEPFDKLKQVTRQGHINGVVDTDNIMRQSLHSINFRGREIYSFPYEIYRLYAERKGVEEGDITPYLDKQNKWYIPYKAKPTQYFGNDLEGTSFIRVLRGEVDPRVFAGDIVIVGPFTTGMMDGYYTPVNKTQQMYGIEVHANTIQAYLEQNFKQDVPREIESILFISFMVFAFSIFQIYSMKRFSIVVASASIVYWIGARLIYEMGWRLTLFYPMLAVAVCYIIKILSAYMKEYREKKQITEIFSRYIAPQVVEKLIAQGYKVESMVGEAKDIAVFFVDIRGFSSLAEKMPAREVVGVLNECLKLTSETIFKYEGMLDKFIGDATMGIFNAPMEQDDYVYRAVQCAREILEGTKELNEKIYKKYSHTIELGVGMSCGECVVGNIGASHRMEYTAIGDVVNTASRIETLAKGGELLITEEVYKQLQGRIEVVDYGEQILKGKTNKVKVYCVKRILD